MSDIRYPMKMVTQRTGLSSHVVRVWERRYEAVTPDRSGTNRRLYSEEEVRRLEILAQLTKSGHTISQIAKLSTPELSKLAANIPETSEEETAAEKTLTNLHAYHETAWEAVVDLDSASLERVLDQATIEIGGSAMIESVIVPLIVRIGDRWDNGEISVAQERAASTVLQEVLTLAGRPHSETRGAPNLIVATPTGQVHELGAALVVCTARRRGWDVTYLGASLPAAEIAHAAQVKGARAVALSIVYPTDDPTLPAELRHLKKLLPEDCPIITGGRASKSYEKVLAEIHAKSFNSLDHLKRWLDDQRTKTS